MKNLLNPDDLIQKDLQAKLDDLEIRPSEHLKECMKLEQKAKHLQTNVMFSLQANLHVIQLRKLETHKEIIRAIWDLEQMNFN